ncbi:cytochrome P450 [Aspergillus pseudodeflectus]|uniref:Cytochrome P450 n=1 Tax=Aspergillus pseudodeflectus TaxID=176178 RepID=A0ABR4K2R4_9EURO
MGILSFYDLPPIPLAVSVIVLLQVFTTAYRKWLHSQFRKTHGCKEPPRVPSYDPLLSLDLVFSHLKQAKSRKLLESTLRNFGTYGNTYRSKRLRTPVIFTRDPENVKTMLSLKFEDWGVSHRYAAFTPLLGQGIFNSDGSSWAHSRQMLRPNFRKEQIAHLDIFEKLLDDFFALIPSDDDGHGAVDLQELFFAFTMDSATEFLFGHNVHSLRKRRLAGNSADDAGFAEAFNYAQDAIITNTRLGLLRAFNRDPKATEAVRTCHAMVEQFVSKALREVHDQNLNQIETASGEDKTKYSFLRTLAQQTGGDRTQIRDELMNVLLAGRDTTASLLSNLFFVLARHPRIWAKLRQEIMAAVGTRAPTYEELRDLKYLKYCLNESLRLHPVVPLNGRTCTRDTILPTGGGPDGRSPVHVSKGTFVIYSTFAMHRLEDSFGPAVDEFRPERWEALRPGWEYLPFNGGPRICLGQQYALTEAAYVTARLAQRFSVLESRDEGPWEEKLALTLCSWNGCMVSVRK